MRADIARLKARVDAISARPTKPLRDLKWAYPRVEEAQRLVAVDVGRLADIQPDHVRGTHQLADLGIDALARVELALGLEEILRFAVQLDCSGWVTVADVVAAVMRTPTTDAPTST